MNSVLTISGESVFDITAYITQIKLTIQPVKPQSLLLDVGESDDNASFINFINFIIIISCKYNKNKLYLHNNK